MSLIQFVLLICIFAAGFGAVRHFRQGRLKLIWLVVWILLWIGAAVIVLLPWTSTLVANLVGVGRGADFVIYFSVVGLAYLVFRLFVKIEDVEREITRIVRALALEEAMKEKEIASSSDDSSQRREPTPKA